MGPTGIGKTDLAFQLYDSSAVEIISVDSVQVYKHLNIGSGKPDKTVLKKYPHKLIDVIEPHESYSTGKFQTDCIKEIKAINASNKTPLLVGGTMLYFKNLFNGLSELPESTEEIREEVELECQQKGLKAMHDYLKEIVSTFKETSDKEFVLDFSNDLNSKKITKSIEIVYGLRNFIGNANKFSNKKIFISLKSNNETTEISIEDDGYGYPSDIFSKIGEPYLKSQDLKNKKQTGLGLGIFIGKTLLEKNFATVNCWNSQTRTGAEIIIKWSNKDLFNL